MIIEINGQQVEVDDSFSSLSEQDQHKEIEHIASSLPKAEASSEVPSVGLPIGTGAVGAVAGPAIGPVIGKAVDIPFEMAARQAAKQTLAKDNVPDAVKKWLSTQTTTPYAGGKTYGEAFEKSEIAGGKPVQSRGAQTPIRRGFLSVQNQPPELTRTQNIAREIIAGERLPKPSLLGRSLGTGLMAGELGNLIENVQSGDYGRAALSGLGALGGAGSHSTIPKVRAASRLLSIGVPAVQYMLPEKKPKEEKAAGGSIQNFQLGGVAKAAGKQLKDIVSGLDKYKLSQVYPDLLPPVKATDPKSGKEFLQKQLSEEALKVQEARKLAQKSIQSGEYEPFFDIEKRFYADPSRYKLAGTTETEIVPKKPETFQKYLNLASSPESIDRILAAYHKGKDLPMAKDWYAMGQLEKEFINTLGLDEGSRQFKKRFADAMAATTGGADPNSNLMMAAYANYMHNAGKPIPTAAYDLPFPIGGRYVSGNMEQAKKLMDLNQIPVTNPKRHNFSANFLGNVDRSTIDEQMSKLFDPKMAAPPPGAYGVYEKVFNDLARSHGVNPANMQDVTWAGAKNYQGKPMMQEVNEAIARTHLITGEHPDEILKGFIKGEKPLYAEGGSIDNDDEEEHKLKQYLNFMPMRFSSPHGEMSGVNVRTPLGLGASIESMKGVDSKMGMPPPEMRNLALSYNTPIGEGGNVGIKFSKDLQNLSGDTRADLLASYPVGRGMLSGMLSGSEKQKLTNANFGYTHPFDKNRSLYGGVNVPLKPGMSPMYNLLFEQRFADGGAVSYNPMGDYSPEFEQSSSQSFPKTPVKDHLKGYLDWVIPFEGKLHKVAGDPGGLTNYGITKFGMADYLGRQATPEDIKAVTPESARDIYTKAYYNKLGLQDYDPKTAILALDAAVNQGPSWTRKALEQTGGDYQKLLEARRARYAQGNPKFRKGWDNRMNQLLSYIDTLPESGEE